MIIELFVTWEKAEWLLIRRYNPALDLRFVAMSFNMYPKLKQVSYSICRVCPYKLAVLKQCFMLVGETCPLPRSRIVGAARKAIAKINDLEIGKVNDLGVNISQVSHR